MNIKFTEDWLKNNFSSYAEMPNTFEVKKEILVKIMNEYGHEVGMSRFLNKLKEKLLKNVSEENIVNVFNELGI